MRLSSLIYWIRRYLSSLPLGVDLTLTWLALIFLAMQNPKFRDGRAGPCTTTTNISILLLKHYINSCNVVCES